MKVKTFAFLGVVIFVISGAFFLRAGGRPPFLDQLLDNLTPFKPQPTTISFSDAVIDDINQVSELTTTTYMIQQVVRNEGGGFATHYLVILVAKGKVNAGLDLDQLDARDVSVSEDGKNITVTLPPVKILTKRSNILSSKEEDTYIYTKIKDITSGANLDEIEQEMRNNAGAQILETACNDGILRAATDDARAAIEQFLKTARSDVNITIVSAPVPSVDECKNKVTLSD